jgi:hypothetical protein
MKKKILNITFLKGLPTMEVVEDIIADDCHNLIVLGNLMHRVVQDMEMLFTQGCHHRRLSVIFITQNIFRRGYQSRTIALNTTYMVLMTNIRDVSQVATLGRQLFPEHSSVDAELRRCTVQMSPYNYLALDMSLHSDDKYRLRTNVFPGEDTFTFQTVYNRN